MKKFVLLFLSLIMVLQTACSNRTSQVLDRDEIKVSEKIDVQKDYPQERPEVPEEIEEVKENIIEKSAEIKEEIPQETPKTEEKVPEEKVELQTQIQTPAETKPVVQENVTEVKKEETIPKEEIPQEKVEIKQEIVEEKVEVKEETPKETPKVEQNVTQNVSFDETRAMWFSYFEIDAMLKGKSEAQFTANISAAFDNLVNLGFNTVIFQVRPYADAIYPSKYFSWSYLASGNEGVAINFDPLKIAVREAHNRGLELEAWINPYRVRNANYKQQICADNIVNDYLKSGDAVEFNGGIYFDPASEKAQELIVNGVREIVQNYNVDAIHFDDYFYPTTDKSFDKKSYQRYCDNGGKLSLENWRRENVNKLVKSVYSAIKAIDNSVKFGISPQGNLDNNYNSQFIDVALWLKNEGYVDYICPQIYFGFQNSTCPYEGTVKEWNNLIKTSSVELKIGLAPFKIGTEDTWASDGKNEWKKNSDLLAKMVETARKYNNYGGFAMFRYDSIFNPSADVKTQVNKEISNLKDVLN